MEEIVVYGAKQPCAFCVQMPSAKDTAEWLQEALTRRLGKRIVVRYVDIEVLFLKQKKTGRNEFWLENIFIL